MNKNSTPVVIGIAGGTGSGKTTVANVILERVGAESIAFIPHDAYYKDLKHLPKAQREIINFDHPDSLESELLVEHLQLLREGGSIQVPVYDFTSHSRTEVSERIDPHPIILVEGILIFAEKTLCDLFDVKIFVDTPPDIRFIRRLERDIDERGRSLESVVQQWMPSLVSLRLLVKFKQPC